MAEFEQEHIGSVAMGDSTPEWRYEIKHGPDGEANYAWLYRGEEMIATMRTRHAVAIAAALSRPVQEPVAQIEFARGTAGRENEMPRVVSCNWLPDGIYSVYAAPQPAHGTSATERVVDAVTVVQVAMKSLYGKDIYDDYQHDSEWLLEKISGVRAMLAAIGVTPPVQTGVEVLRTVLTEIRTLSAGFHISDGGGNEPLRRLSNINEIVTDALATPTPKEESK